MEYPNTWMVSTIDQNCAHTHTHTIIDMCGHYVCMYLYVDIIYVYYIIIYIYYVYSQNLCISMQCTYLLYTCLTQETCSKFKTVEDLSYWWTRMYHIHSIYYHIHSTLLRCCPLMIFPSKRFLKAAMNFCGMRAMISFRRALVEHHHAAYMSREGRLYYTLGSHGHHGAFREEAGGSGGRCGDTGGGNLFDCSDVVALRKSFRPKWLSHAMSF